SDHVQRLAFVQFTHSNSSWPRQHIFVALPGRQRVECVPRSDEVAVADSHSTNRQADGTGSSDGWTAIRLYSAAESLEHVRVKPDAVDKPQFDSEHGVGHSGCLNARQETVECSIPDEQSEFPHEWFERSV